MNLRLRLIVAFFLFSVVPLAAVTLYWYTSNVRALQVAAQHEAEMLTSELTQRMQVVTTQISERVEHLMDMPAVPSVQKIVATGASTGRTPSARPAAPRPAAPPPVAIPPSPPATVAADANAVASQTIDPNTVEGQVAGALGEVAMLLNNVEVRGLGRGGNRGSRAGRSGASEEGAAGSPDASSAETPAAGRGVSRFPPPGPRPARPGAIGASGPPDRADAAEGVVVNSDPTHMKLDLTPIRRELFREMTSSGSFDKMTPEERQRVGREVNQRLLGIVQGIQLGAAELQKKAEETQRQAAAARAAEVVPKKAPAVPRVPVVRPPPAPPAVAEPAAPAVPAAPAPAPKPMTRTAALSGTRLDVRVERNGQVVQQVNAEINLPNLLATVFANTRRDSGEIPFAVGKDGHVYASSDADRETLTTLGVARVDDSSGTRRVGNWVVVTRPDRSGAGLRFGIARPVGNLLNDLRRTTVRNAGLGLLFIGIALVGIVPLSGRLTRNLSSLTDGVGRIAEGDYSARVPVKARDEIGRLAAAFNRMAADVERHQRAAIEQERIRRELEVGRRIQSDMLPHTPLHFGLTEVKGVSVPAREVGGDFFNYFQLDSGQVALLVGDVSGKGVGAALLMANIQASLRTRFALGQELSAIAEAIDRDIEDNSPGPVYATLFLAIFDPGTRQMRYVNAGHNPQFVLRGDGRLEKMSSTGLPVGMFAGRGYKELAVQLAPGDLLFFYTDGCVETENEAGDMFGSDRLEALVAASVSGSADQVLATVEQAISTFRGGRDLFDDATMMAVKVG